MYRAAVVQERQCDNLKVVVISAEKMPFIARNIKLAWADGQPGVLHRESVNANLPIDEGQEYLVVISHPDEIASDAWAGQEVKVGQCLS